MAQSLIAPFVSGVRGVSRGCRDAHPQGQAGAPLREQPFVSLVWRPAPTLPDTFPRHQEPECPGSSARRLRTVRGLQRPLPLSRFVPHRRRPAHGSLTCTEALSTLAIPPWPSLRWAGGGGGREDV